MNLKELNEFRKSGTYKKPRDENFLEDLNQTLYQKERKEYASLEPEHPIALVFGLPRSGTTLTAQVVTHGLGLHYIDNIAARFYLAPLHGIKLSRAIGGEKNSLFKSDHAVTSDLTDIHEFGYFWRHHLRKEKLTAPAELEQAEAEIDWPNLKRVLANMLQTWGGPALFKNIFGAFHIPRLVKEIPNCLFIYIERDSADVAMSLYKARQKFYGGDVKKWWSTAPPEIRDLLDLPVEEQIAGQVFYLHRFYEKELQKIPEKNKLWLHYSELTGNPKNAIEKAQAKMERLGAQLKIRPEAIPATFETRTYATDDPFLKKFKKAYQTLQENHAPRP